jgi:PLP dependent protein|tara:strand:- start:107 stop:745 length:639 start_codon:yes stop_codon:yes gene_type:complete
MFSFEEYKKIRKNIDFLDKKTEIVAISKNHPLEDVEKAISCGLEIFGENRVQEAKLKFEEIKEKNKKIKLHLTGPLQTNKVNNALQLFDVFHTLDREKLLKELSKFPEIIKQKSFFVQLNTGKETTKSGIFPEDAKRFIELCKNYGVNNIEGLMCIPPINDNPKKHFLIVDELTREFGLGRPSIGMSSDYEHALSFDPKYIRVGTILFGKRI